MQAMTRTEQFRNAHETEAGNSHTVSRRHRKNGAAVEPCAKRDDDCDVSEDVKRTHPNGRPVWSMRQIATRQAMDASEMYRSIDSNERLVRVDFLPVLVPRESECTDLNR